MFGSNHLPLQATWRLPSWVACRAALATAVYAWLLFQGFGGLAEFAPREVGSRAQGGTMPDQGPDPDHHLGGILNKDNAGGPPTLMAQTSIVTQSRQCVHHRVACPPQCHCPPLKAEAATETGVDFGSEMGAESRNLDLDLDERSDLLPGDAAYETCHSLPVQAVVWGAMPPHLRPGITNVILTATAMAFSRHDGLRFQSIDLMALDKVPIA